MKNNFYQKSFVTVESLTVDDVECVMEKTDEMEKLVREKGGDDRLQYKVMAALFYEPSSRTFSSFVSSMQRLGGGIIPLNGMSHTSVIKGETLEDTVRVFSCFADIIVMRNPEVGSAEVAAKYAYVPVINAGDGKNEHPTQALYDVYTMLKHFSSCEGLTVGMIGDLFNGRTVHSLSKLLVKLGTRIFYWVSPKVLKMPREIYTAVTNAGGEVIETENVDEILPKIDVMYVTRVQKERFANLHEYEKLKLNYIITADVLKSTKKDMIIMHPLPRVGEISPEIDTDPRAVYLREQMRNGLYVRMALLDLILRK